MQQFLKDHPALRISLISLAFLLGLVLVFVGWKMTGQLKGLGLMLGGVASLILALYLYNNPFQ